jgi:outer membrane receptor protein involved in Fe transport
MVFRYSFFLLLFLITCYQARPDGVIKGRIFDQSTGSGLQDASVSVRRNQGTNAGPEGLFLLKLPPGKVTLVFQHIGYKTLTRDLQIIDKDTVVLNIGMAPEVAEIDQVVVSAGRVEQRISELSVSMSIIKPSALTNLHISDTKELINKTPGIEVLDGQASIRGGSGFSYGAGSRVMALLDGLPVMSADAGNIRWGFLPLENISQIEIIKGASSVAYGSSALNGVINFRTADPGNKPETRFYTEAGVFGNPRNLDWKWWDTPRRFYTASASHLQKFGNTSLGLSFNYLDDNGYRRLNDQKSGRISLKIKQQSKQYEGLSYGLSFNGGATVKTDFVLWENALTGALKHDEATAIQLHSQFFTLDPFLQFISGPSRHDIKARLQISQNKFPDSAQNNSDASNSYAEYQFGHQFSDLISLNTGISENYSWIRSNFYGNHNSLNIGAFAQLDFNASRRLKYTVGVRMEQNWLDSESDKLVPLLRAGINFRVRDYTFLRASFGEGYRFPSIAEKHAATTLGSVKIFPSPFIRPEKGWNAEIGVKQGIGTSLFSGLVDLSVFYSQHTDMIEYLFGIYPDPGATTYSYGFKASNLEAARVYGAELEFSIAKKTGRVNNILTGGYTFMYPAEFNPISGKNTGLMLKYRRKHAASLNIQSQYRNFDVSLGLYVKSKILRIDDVFLDASTRESLLPGFFNYWNEHNTGYMLMDASLGYSLTKHYRISFMVKNLTNTEYMGRPGDIQPQRNFSLRLSGNF